MGEKEEGQTNKHKEFIESLVKEQPVTRAFNKLNKAPLEVSVYRHTSAVQALEDELLLIDEAMSDCKDDKLKEQLLNRKSKTEEEIKKLEADRIEGVLTHLTYRDVNDIKAAVTEAVVHFREYKFDPEVVMARIVAEERFMTVFCCLKKKDDVHSRYFKSLDDIAQMDELTVFDIYNKWEKHFVLTEEELKN